MKAITSFLWVLKGDSIIDAVGNQNVEKIPAWTFETII